MQWIACRVITGKEYEIRARINKVLPDAIIEVPRLYHKEIVDGRVKTRSERMMPGYILVGSERPFSVGLIDSFIEVIGDITQEEYDIIKSKEGHKDEKIETGAKILVIDGPFQGCKGRIDLEDVERGILDCTLVFSGMEIKAKLKTELVSAIS